MNQCKGCASDQVCGILHDYKDFVHNCPCSICIVKAICITEICDDYRNFCIETRGRNDYD